MTDTDTDTADTTDAQAAMASSLLPSFRAALRSFAASPAAYQHIRSTPAAAPPAAAAKRLFILDSSFNPPTRAHFRMALSALTDADGAAEDKRLLLLLATNNADKAPKPAPFDERLAMMSLLAGSLSASASAAVDIALTKHARFLDKARALEADGCYGAAVDEFVWLTGFDTLVRLLDPRYYPEAGHRLDGLARFFERSAVWCMGRVGAGCGEGAEQRAWVGALAEGALEAVGGRSEWARRVRFVESEVVEEVSSTRVREAVRAGEKEVLGTLLTDEVRAWVLGRGLYADEGRSVEHGE